MSTNSTDKPVDKPKRGRPKKHIDLELVEKLAAIQCTQPEIASALNVSVDTLWRHPKFAEVYKRGSEGGRKSLRRLQFESAMKGNVGMLIWLGKQYLGQSDQISNNVRRIVSPAEMTDEELGQVIAEMEAKIKAKGGTVDARYQVVKTDQPVTSTALPPPPNPAHD